MVQLTEEQLSVLKELAKTRKTSVARLVRESVAQYVATTLVDKEERRRRMLAALEAIDKAQFQDIDGATDVSVNHDKYLAEIYGTW